MEENRFTRAYQEFKREKEQQTQQQIEKKYDNNSHNRNRFACLVEDRLPPVRVSSQDNRFACLLDNYSKPYTNYSPTYSNATYISRPRTEIKPLPPVKKPTPPPPPLTFDSTYHFPDLVKNTENKSVTQAVEKPQLKKATIVETVKIQKGVAYTSISFKDGKYIQKDIYEDGTTAGDEKAPLVIKKPIYSSWASVLKPKINQVVYYEED